MRCQADSGVNQQKRCASEPRRGMRRNASRDGKYQSSPYFCPSQLPHTTVLSPDDVFASCGPQTASGCDHRLLGTQLARRGVCARAFRPQVDSFRHGAKSLHAGQSQRHRLSCECCPPGQLGSGAPAAPGDRFWTPGLTTGPSAGRDLRRVRRPGCTAPRNAYGRATRPPD